MGEPKEEWEGRTLEDRGRMYILGRGDWWAEAWRLEE